MRGHDGSHGPLERPACYTCGSRRLDTLSPEFACCQVCGDEHEYSPLWVFPGDRIYRWWDAGISMDPQELTVVRVNRTTVTVRTDQFDPASGVGQFRLPHADVVGFVDWDDQ